MGTQEQAAGGMFVRGSEARVPLCGVGMRRRAEGRSGHLLGVCGLSPACASGAVRLMQRTGSRFLSRVLPASSDARPARHVASSMKCGISCMLRPSTMPQARIGTTIRTCVSSSNCPGCG